MFDSDLQALSTLLQSLAMPHNFEAMVLSLILVISVLHFLFLATFFFLPAMFFLFLLLCNQLILCERTNWHFSFSLIEYNLRYAGVREGRMEAERDSQSHKKLAENYPHPLGVPGVLPGGHRWIDRPYLGPLVISI